MRPPTVGGGKEEDDDDEVANRKPLTESNESSRRTKRASAINKGTLPPPRRGRRGRVVISVKISPDRRRKTMSSLRRIGALSLLMIWLTILASNMTQPIMAIEEEQEATSEEMITPSASDPGGEQETTTSSALLAAHNESSHQLIAAKTSSSTTSQQQHQQVERNKDTQTNNQAHQQQQQNPLIGRTFEDQRRPVVTGRQSRIYRIRAIGSNGSFAGSVLRLNPLQSSLIGGGGSSSSSFARPTETKEPTTEESRQPATEEPPNEEAQKFGARQSAPSAKLVVAPPSTIKQSQQQQQKACTSSSPSPSSSSSSSSSMTGADGETTAEASSISASSQTLRLTSKPASGSPQQQLVAGQQRAAGSVSSIGGGGASRQAARGELDESLLAPQSTAANEQQSTLESASGTIGIGGGGQAERAPSLSADQPRSSASVESILSLIDDFDSKITTNKTEAQLSCDSGEMVIRLNFTEPFRGVVYPDHNRLSPCRFFGDGHHNYELRLPLRSCGTRQVAPRVFVNDVIVRFHKTLELEEDEVKTLICRYPPPLDASLNSGANLAAGNGLVHELGGSGSQIDPNRPSLASSGESHLNHQPFELVDPASGRPTNRLGGIKQSQPETFGELLAPSGGRHRTQSGDTLFTGSNLSPAERILFRQQHNNNNNINEPLLSTSSSGIKQLNSRLFQPEPARTLESGDQRGGSLSLSPNGAANSPSSFFDRLTSIELLFLISSLMFLVLLAFGLAGGYYCFSRRNRRETPAGAQLLRRQKKRSYFNSPTSLLTSSTPVPSSATARAAGQPYYQRAAGLPPASGRAAGHHMVPVSSSSSRQAHHLLDQDLYPAAAAGGRQPAGSYYQQYLHQQQQQQQAPSSPDDSDISGQQLLPATGSTGGTRPGTRFNYLSANTTTAAPITSAHYQSSTLRPHYNHHHHPSGPAIVGRRQAQDLSAVYSHHHQLAGGRRAAATAGQQSDRPFGSAALRSSATELRSQSSQQQQQHDQYHNPNHYNHHHLAGTSTLGRRGVTNRPIGSGDPLSVADGSSQHHRNQYRINNQNRHHQSQQQKQPPPSKQQQQQRALPLASQTIAANLYYAQMRHAKSLQQLRDKSNIEWSNQDQEDQYQEDYLNDDKIRQKQRQHFYDTSTLTRQDVDGTNSGRTTRESAELRVHDMSAGSSSSTASDSELDGPDGSDGRNRPKLILKSIEDSFVTNLTEIYGQEYKKRDTTRPLSLAEWRSRQPMRRGPAPGEPGGAPTNHEHAGESQPDDVMEHGTMGQTNLRSLTELDVNFAKSMLRPTVATLASASSGQLPQFGGAQSRPINTSPSTTTTNTTSQQKQAPASSTVSSSGTKNIKPAPASGGTGIAAAAAGTSSVVAAETSKQAAARSSMDDDLVISPDYNHGRLKLRPNNDMERPDGGGSPGGSSISHESISYV
uniref:ZP domain-containing protein n=1 Tax=Aceria tosichella TaxID=561515 RepID=A0A6G1SLP7_9ACAR